MQERIEPPILISRLMTFVMATAVVVLGVLIFTLDKMFPLNRPQIFVLTSQNLNDKEITLTQMPEVLEDYKQQFILEYVRERNEIVPDLAIMRGKWANNDQGIVKTRSTDAVFGAFAMTDMVNIIRQDLDEAFTVKCSVEYPADRRKVLPKTDSCVRGVCDTYIVSFTYVCTFDTTGDMEYKQSYRLLVKIKSDTDDAVRWSERMENPLGLRISDYQVIDASGKILNLEKYDPLNWSRKDEM